MSRYKPARLAFHPSPDSLEYFLRLSERLTAARGLRAHITQREAFDRMVEYARVGERITTLALSPPPARIESHQRAKQASGSSSPAETRG